MPVNYNPRTPIIEWKNFGFTFNILLPLWIVFQINIYNLKFSQLSIRHYKFKKKKKFTMHMYN